MGYNTEFVGVFRTDKPLAANHWLYLKKFSESRRMKRDAKLTAKLSDPVRESVLPTVGVEGGYYVAAKGTMGQDSTEDVVDYNNPPIGQPGLWCDWTVNEKDFSVIEWNGGEKFYNYIEWIKYLIANFLEPWGYKLNGVVQWHGEEAGDMGAIVIKDNVVEVVYPSKLPDATK